MKRPFQIALFLGIALLASRTETGFASAPGGMSDAEVQARASALEVAGAFSNDGFKIRDGHWLGPIAPKERKLIQVNLYAGNQYWFIAAGSEGAKRLVVSIFDETGKAIPTEPYENTAQSAAGFSPSASGPYYVCIEEAEGVPATFCLLYSYK